MGLYSGGRGGGGGDGLIYGPTFALRFWWAYIRGGLYSEFYGIILTMYYWGMFSCSTHYNLTKNTNFLSFLVTSTLMNRVSHFL